MIQLQQINLDHLGIKLPSGDIRLEDRNRKYKRIRQKAEDVLFLDSLGFIEVMSSNVSAVRNDGRDLLVRFHGGAVYRYFNKGHLFNDMMKAPSKGKFVWQEFRYKQVNYQRESNISLPRTHEMNIDYNQLTEHFANEYKRFNIPIQGSTEEILKLLIKSYSLTNPIQLSNLGLINIMTEILGHKISEVK